MKMLDIAGTSHDQSSIVNQKLAAFAVFMVRWWCIMNQKGFWDWGWEGSKQACLNGQKVIVWIAILVPMFVV
jgi:hypothetical protein